MNAPNSGVLVLENVWWERDGVGRAGSPQEPSTAACGERKKNTSITDCTPLTSDLSEVHTTTESYRITEGGKRDAHQSLGERGSAKETLGKVDASVDPREIPSFLPVGRKPLQNGCVFGRNPRNAHCNTTEIFSVLLKNLTKGKSRV